MGETSGFTNLISIIMPVYNGEQYIGDAIRSVIYQEYTNWELIIVNDGSTDNTQKRIQEFADSRLRVIEQPNRGVSAARNTGIRAMTGKYLCFLDSDDEWPSNSLLSRIKIFENNLDTKFVDGKVEIYDSALRSLLGDWQPSFRGMPFHHLVRLNGKCFFGPTWMIRLDGDRPEFDEQLSHGEDLLFYISIATRGRYDYTDELILKYRKGQASAMTNFDGLAHGYTYLCSKISTQYNSDTTIMDRLLLILRARKIMFLTFWNDRDYLKAIKYVIFGHL